MKVTNSADGVKRVDLRVTHRLGAEELAQVLCSAYRHHSPDEDGPLPRLSIERVRSDITQELWHRGQAGLEGWSDYLTQPEMEERLEWAMEAVLRMEPGLREDPPARS